MPTWLTVERALLVVLIATVAWLADATRTDRHMLEKVGELTITMQAALKENTEAVAALKAAPPAPPAPCVPDLSRAPMGAGGAGGVGGAAGPLARRDPAAAAASPDGAAAAMGSPRSARARKLAAMPGNVLARMYDAADRMSEDEQWDDATYNQVTGVFEESAGRAAALFEDLQSGALQPAEARDQAVALRDEVTTKLVGVIGADGVTRLKGYLAQREPPR